MKGMQLKSTAFRTMSFFLLVATVILGAALSSAAPNAWSKLDLDGIRVNAMVVDPTNPSIIYVGTNGGGVFRSTNKGQSWALVNNGLGNLFVNDLMLDPRDRSVILAATGRGIGDVLPDVLPGIYRSTNRGDTWTRQFSASADALAVDPANPTTMFAASVNVALQSFDGGVTWSPAMPLTNVNGTGIAVSTFESNVVLMVTNTESGVGQVFRSTDGGAHWSVVLGGLPPLFDVTFAPPDESGAPAFISGTFGVFRSVDGGQTFTRVTEELGDISVFKVLVNPLAANTIFGASASGVIQSIDGGTSWTELDGTLGNRTVRGLGIDLSSPQTLYAGTEDGPWAFTFAPPPPPPPPAAVSWFFSEASSQPPFDTWFLLQNPTGQTATATLNYLLQGGGLVTQVVPVPPTSRVSVFANQVLPNQAFSMRIDSNQQIFAERAMYVSFDGHSVTGLSSPSRTWLFAEGSTQQPFHTWILLANQNSVPVPATITYLLENGQTVVQQLGALPPLSRTSVFVNQVLPDVAFSSRIDSDVPIVAERAMYRFPGNAATGVVGVPSPARTWFFAEGRGSLRAMDADTFLLLQNPNANSVTATIRLFRTDGTVQTIARSLPPTSRTTIQLDLLFSGDFGISVEADGDIIAERSVFFGNEPKGAYATQGATQLGTVWLLPEGSTATPFDEIVSVLNPTNSNMGVRAEFTLEIGQVIVREFTVGPNRKFDIVVDNIIPDQAVSTRIVTTAPTVVERVMLINKSSVGGHNTVGIRQR